MLPGMFTCRLGYFGNCAHVVLLMLHDAAHAASVYFQIHLHTLLHFTQYV